MRGECDRNIVFLHSYLIRDSGNGDLIIEIEFRYGIKQYMYVVIVTGYPSECMSLIIAKNDIWQSICQNRQF